MRPLLWRRRPGERPALLGEHRDLFESAGAEHPGAAVAATTDLAAMIGGAPVTITVPAIGARAATDGGGTASRAGQLVTAIDGVVDAECRWETGPPASLQLRSAPSAAPDGIDAGPARAAVPVRWPVVGIEEQWTP